MDRREFIKKSGMAVMAATVSPLLASPLGKIIEETRTNTGMKKIMIIDGGPRKNMNTAAMVEKFAEGAREAGAEVKVVRLYDIDYKGCRSCMACQQKGKRVDSCRFKDGLTDVLAEVTEADGLVIASPIYYGEFTAMTRAFWERLTFPWLSYSKGTLVAPKKMPVTMIYTMNATPEQAAMTLQSMQGIQMYTGMAFGCEVEVIQANNTTQVNIYERFDFFEGTAEAKKAWKDAHWEQDLQKAFEAGKRMAMK